MFWGKKKIAKKILTSKETVMLLKSTANSVLQDFYNNISILEIVTLNSLISFLDKFLLNAYVDGKLKHSTWILARLIEVKVMLSTSSNPNIKNIVELITKLEELIYIEKAVNKNV